MAETSSSTISYFSLNGGGKSGKLVGIIKNDTVSFPTVRPDGNPIKNEDYVKIDTNAKLPITIEGITFENLTDQAYFFNNSWILKTQNSATINGVKVEGQKTGDQYGLINSKQGSENAGKVPMVNKKGDIEFVKIETSSKQNAYSSLVKLEGEQSGYTYKATYEDIDYDYAYQEFAKLKPSANFSLTEKEIAERIGKNKIGGCTAFWFMNMIGRTFDWTYSNVVEFNISTPARNKLLQVKGMAQNSQLTKSIVESGEYNESYKLLPYNMADGNNKGLYIAQLVVPCEKGYTTGTTPKGELQVELCNAMLVRYVLDHFDNVLDAVSFLQEHASIYNPTTLFEIGYDLHFLIADRFGNHGAIEFINNEVVYIDGVEVLSNFHIYGTIPNADGTYYTPYDVSQDPTHDPIAVNGLTAHASGVERHKYVVNALKLAHSEDYLQMILYNIIYTNLYTKEKGAEDYWYSDLVGEYMGVDYMVNTPIETYNQTNGIVDRAKEEYSHRSRETGATWQTCHGGLFRFDTLTSYLVFQENMSKLFAFTFDYYTKEEVDELLSHISVEGALKYNEYQNLSSEEFNMLMQNQKLNARIDQRPVYEEYLHLSNLDIPFNQFVFIVDNISLAKGFSVGETYNILINTGNESVMGTGYASNENTLVVKDAKATFGKMTYVVLNETYQEIRFVFEDVKETPTNLTSIQIDRIGYEETYVPIDIRFIPQDNTKQDKQDGHLATISKEVVSAINEVNERVDNISPTGRFLSYWNAATGTPETNPSTIPFEYKSGDWFSISIVGETNYQPTPNQYDGNSSTIEEKNSIEKGDVYRYDGTVWKWEHTAARDVQFRDILGNPTDNAALNLALSNKLDKSSLAYKLYGTNGNGGQDLYSAAWFAGENTIPVRGGNGTINVGTPTSNEHATTKEYVDNRIVSGNGNGISKDISHVDLNTVTSCGFYQGVGIINPPQNSSGSGYVIVLGHHLYDYRTHRAQIFVDMDRDPTEIWVRIIQGNVIKEWKKLTTSIPELTTTEDGTYVCKAIKSGNTITYNWVKE